MFGASGRKFVVAHQSGARGETQGFAGWTKRVATVLNRLKPSDGAAMDAEIASAISKAGL